MNEKKIEELVAKLIVKTKNKEAIWNLTSRDNEFILNFEKGGSITTDNWPSDNGIPCVDLNIRNDKGLIIYTVSYTEVENEEKYKFLNELHRAASESYFNVEDTLDDILKDINSNKIIGKADDSDKMPW